MEWAIKKPKNNSAKGKENESSSIKSVESDLCYNQKVRTRVSGWLLTHTSHHNSSRTESHFIRFFSPMT